MYCLNCAYNLVGIEPVEDASGDPAARNYRCPECGRHFNPASTESWANTPGTRPVSAKREEINASLAWFGAWWSATSVVLIGLATLGMNIETILSSDTTTVVASVVFFVLILYVPSGILVGYPLLVFNLRFALRQTQRRSSRISRFATLFTLTAIASLGFLCVLLLLVVVVLSAIL
ncbi:MAG: hypothetical protein AB7Q00_10305 [Phycisphaerales bacterium]